MLVLADVEPDYARATAAVRRALASGAGVEKFREVIANQGGNPAVVDDYSKLPGTADRDVVVADRDGVVMEMKAEAVGRAAVLLGAGRDRLDAAVDPAVGFTIAAPVGRRVSRGDAIVEIHHRAGRGLAAARQLLEGAIVVRDAPMQARPLILERIGVAGEL